MADELADSAARLFAAHLGRLPDEGVFPEPLWAAVEEAGFTAALLPEAAGGFGASTAEAFGLVRVAAAHAAPIPLGEAMLAGSLLGRAGFALPGGVLSLAPVRRERLRLEREGEGWRLTGQGGRVPWARVADALAVLAEGPDGPMLALVPATSFRAEPGANLAGEPRDTVTFDGPIEARPSPVPAHALRPLGAALRTVQIAGALDRLLPLCVEYAQTRQQFGRPIGKFQAIQHSLAVLAGQAAAAGAAAEMAVDAIDRGLDPFVIGAAKARAGEAAGAAAAIAHQVHGAIGFTQEYQLHPLTRRLWSWRDEFGNEAEWNEVVGRRALRAGADGLWPAITEAA